MRWLSRFLLAALVAGVPPHVQYAAAAAENAAAPPPSSTTTVDGVVPPELRGTWLMVANGKIVLNAKGADGHGDDARVRNTLELWAVDGQGADLKVELVNRELPDTLRKDLDDANTKLVAWKPSAAQLAELRRSFTHLQPTDPARYQSHTFKLADPPHYQSAFRAELQGQLADSVLGAQVDHTFRPQPLSNQAGAQLMADKAVYAVTRLSADVIEGEHVRTVLAAGFVPIPISTQGPFQLYRLRGPEGSPPLPGEQPTVGERFAGLLRALFRGCR